jgi:hypothetical protein
MRFRSSFSLPKRMRRELVIRPQEFVMEAIFI